MCHLLLTLQHRLISYYFLSEEEKSRAMIVRTWKYMIVLALLLLGTMLTSFQQGHAFVAHAQSHADSVTEFAIPTGFDPWGVAIDGRGAIWVALPGCDPNPQCAPGTPPGKLAIFDSIAKSWSRIISLPPQYGQPLSLTFDHTGNLWFPMPATNTLGRYNPGTNTFSQWTIPTPNAGPWDVAVDARGLVWLTEHNINKIAAFDPVTQRFQEIATPAANSNPYGITVDASDNIWFTENNVALIGEYTAQGALQEYKIRTTSTGGLTPHDITVDARGNVWWSEGWADGIGTLNVEQARPGTDSGVKEYLYTPPCLSCGSHTSGISISSDGVVWFDDALQGIIGSMPVTGGAFTFYPTSTFDSHPHDGLLIDSHNQVWFAEEFADKLGMIP
jgi:streptogramin lyase